ncbi:MAG: enoyl-CoA hydratase/isomerase family protein [Candidatus Eiseniibacteriota bacterium]|nr:MAG: enoyl-CoA hydratase/isomerase family protein [Candidatus Eisenbacteria bacterium]
MKKAKKAKKAKKVKKIAKAKRSLKERSSASARRTTRTTVSKRAAAAFPYKSTPKSIGWEDIEVLFIGAGTMGASLAQAYAQNGLNVGILDVSDVIVQKAFDTISGELDAATGRIFSPSEVEAIKARILGTTSYEEACRGRNLKLVVETATERIDIKKEIFKKLDKLCAPHVVLATNSSSLDTNVLAFVTKRPDKVVWMHYFYLPHKNRAGEYAGSDTASEESINTAARYMKLGGKVSTRIWSSRKGGAADVVFVALLHEAVKMLQEGHDVATIEAAGKNAYNMPLGFLALMDSTGLPVGLYSMKSFSDSSNPADRLYKTYRNFFEPTRNYIELMKKYDRAEDKSQVRWASEAALKKPPKSPAAVKKLAERFLGVGFATSVEVVDANVIEMEDLERLAQNAFLWAEGPFTIMNRIGIRESFRMVKQRAALARKERRAFPVPELLKKQARSGKPWPLKMSPVFYGQELDGKLARITISNPKNANAMDNLVFKEWEKAFEKAKKDPKVKAIIFDSAPIKTFIAGANVGGFIDRIRKKQFDHIKRDTAMWQEVMFRKMTGRGKPKIAIVDGATFGGGVEVAMAFANDPNSVVIITERTSFALPETRLGIYPGLRGTLLLPQLIYRATNDAELAVAIARYYILAGSTVTSSPRLIKYLGMADFLVPAHTRDQVAETIARAIVKKKGKALTKRELKALGIAELPTELTLEEKEELRVMKDLFLKPDLIPTLYAHGRGQAPLFLSGDEKALARRVATRVSANSPHAVAISDWLISKGFDDHLKGVSTEKLAERELENYLVPTFEHPDALIGLEALVNRRFPEFRRSYPF